MGYRFQKNYAALTYETDKYSILWFSRERIDYSPTNYPIQRTAIKFYRDQNIIYLTDRPIKLSAYWVTSTEDNDGGNTSLTLADMNLSLGTWKFISIIP